MIHALLDGVRRLLPDHDVKLPVLWGPFRGARLTMNPRHSMRKVCGLYEHELNSWLVSVLPRVDRVIDVGANDGYFTFGCAAVFLRDGREGTIVAIEPLAQHAAQLRDALANVASGRVQVTIKEAFADVESADGRIAIRDLAMSDAPSPEGKGTLIKIDVEGAVLAGAGRWLRAENYFLIEVHDASYLEPIQALLRRHRLVPRVVAQQALPLLGRERRVADNWWIIAGAEPPHEVPPA